MKNYCIKNIRNVGLIGHSGSGKSSFMEALLFKSGSIDRLGKIEDGTTISDFSVEEKRRGISLSVSIAPIEYRDNKINLIDIPGDFDFVGELAQGMRAADIATIVVSGVSGIKVGVEKAWEYCEKIKLPRCFFINKLDRENSNFDKVLNDLRKSFGNGVVPITYPIGKEENFKGIIDIISKSIIEGKVLDKNIPDEISEAINKYREMLIESLAENDEKLFDKYINEEEISEIEIYNSLKNEFINGNIVPVICGSSLSCIGMESFLEYTVNCFPSPDKAIKQKALNKENNEEVFINFDEEKPFSAFVFKTIVDPFVGKISLFKVITGNLSNEISVSNSNKDKIEKISNIFFLKGKNQITTKTVIAGDIAAVSKLQYTETGDTLCETNNKILYDKINFPRENISMAIFPKEKGDEDKISIALQRLLEEDPTFKVSKNTDNGETIISGLGETHIEIIASKIKNKFGVEVILKNPKIQYKESIRGKSDVQGKHKKQSGGHGQYGDVKIKFEPRTDGEFELEFIDNVVGGSVPRNFIPAVEKGLKECMIKGVLAGYPVVGLRAILYDGSYHPVDSSEMSFKLATSIAYKRGLEKANPILLEPIMKLEIYAPDEYMGDIMGDINKRRGRIIGIEQKEKLQKITCEAPLAEAFNYCTDLRSITQARGCFTSEFIRYEEVPETEAKKVIEEALKK